MTEKKRFEFEFDMNISDNLMDKEYDMHEGDEAFEFLDLINNLNKENEQLKTQLTSILKLNEKLRSRIKYLERKIERERNATNKQYEKWEKEALEKINKLEKENEQLKKQRYDLYMDIAKLVKENEQLKQSNERLLKMLDNVANYIQKQYKDVSVDDFAEWWNNMATKGLKKELEE